MRKIILTTIASSFLFFQAQAADVVCACKQTKCSDVTISFVPSSPGVYLSVEYAYGERNTEGFAQVTRDEKGRTIYTLGQFTLVEDNNKYFLPGRDTVCQ
jgi:hypothetical protein